MFGLQRSLKTELRDWQIAILFRNAHISDRRTSQMKCPLENALLENQFRELIPINQKSLRGIGVWRQVAVVRQVSEIVTVVIHWIAMSSTLKQISLKLKLFIQKRQIAMPKYINPVIETEKIWINTTSIKSTKQRGRGVKALIFFLKSQRVSAQGGLNAANIPKGTNTIGKNTIGSEFTSKKILQLSLISFDKGIKYIAIFRARKAMLRVEKIIQVIFSTGKLTTFRSFAGTLTYGFLSILQGLAMVRMTETIKKIMERKEKTDWVNEQQAMMSAQSTI